MEMVIVTVVKSASASGLFSDTPCRKGLKYQGLTGTEHPIMAGTGSCRRCKYHQRLPSGKDSFGCIIKENKRN